jgi:hypothetical protein
MATKALRKTHRCNLQALEINRRLYKEGEEFCFSAPLFFLDGNGSNTKPQRNTKGKSVFEFSVLRLRVLLGEDGFSPKVVKLLFLIRKCLHGLAYPALQPVRIEFGFVNESDFILCIPILVAIQLTYALKQLRTG